MKTISKATLTRIHRIDKIPSWELIDTDKAFAEIAHRFIETNESACGYVRVTSDIRKSVVELLDRYPEQMTLIRADLHINDVNTLVREYCKGRVWSVADYATAANKDRIRLAYLDAVRRYRNGEDFDVTIGSNEKTNGVMFVSLLPFLTCGKNCKGTCDRLCYAAKFCNCRCDNYMPSRAKNTALAIANPLKYFYQIEKAVKMLRFFRWHESGDIINRPYFKAMVQIALNNQHCEFLAFTKQFAIVNAWIRENGELPKNLHIVFSAWYNLEPDNPFNLPLSYPYNANYPAKEESFSCGGNCEACACKGVGCWQLKKGQSIAFEEH